MGATSQQRAPIPSITLGNPIKAEQAGLGRGEVIPSIDIKSPIGYQSVNNGSSTNVPAVPVDSKLRVETVTDNSDIPESDLKAPLNFDATKEPDRAHRGFRSENLLLILGVLTALVVIGVVIFVYRLI